MQPYVYANDTLKTRDGELVGVFDNFKIRDRNGILRGEISVPWILDSNRERVAKFEDGVLQDLDKRRIVSTRDIGNAIEGPKNIVLAALWFFLVRADKRVHIVSLRQVREGVLVYPEELSTADAAANVARQFLEDRDREGFLGIYLNTKHKLVGVELTAVGSTSSVVIAPGTIFRGALLNCASAVIFAHNHPSGDPTPSPEDYQITSVLIECGKLLGINVLDHLVIGDECHVSIRELRPELFLDSAA